MTIALTATYASQEDLIVALGFTIDDCPLSTDQLNLALNNAQAEVDNRTNTKFYDGTSSTPGYEAIPLEKHTGKGQNNLNYYLRNYPVVDLTTTLDGDVTAGGVTITVDSTDGFNSSGYIQIGSNKIQYTGKTDTTFTGCANVEAHSDGDTVYSTIIELSTSIEGQTPAWTVLSRDSDYNFEYDTGSVSLYNSSIDYNANSTTFTEHPSYQVANRLRVTYLTGWTSIPQEIKNVTVMIAAKQLMFSIVRKATIQGLNDFNPTMINIDEDYIRETLSRYKSDKSQTV